MTQFSGDRRTGHRRQRGSLLPGVAVVLSTLMVTGAGVSSMISKMDDRLRLDQAVQSGSLALARACARHKVRYGDGDCPTERYRRTVEAQMNVFLTGQQAELQSVQLIEQDDGRYRVTASVTGSTFFLLSVFDGPIVSENTVSIGYPQDQVEPAKPVEVALVVDNSGSMGTSFDGKPAVEHLRDAMNTFIDGLPQAAGKLQNIRLAVMPFTHLVALHPQGESRAATTRSCYEGDPESFDYSRSIWERLMIGPWSQSGADEFPDQRETWSFFGDCNEQMQAHYLTDDADFIRDNLALMHATGSTSTELGLIWGWRALDPRWRQNRPESSYASPFDKSQKIIVLFSDAPGQTSVPMVLAGAGDDSHFDSLCGSIKARGIELFTVRLGTSGGSTLKRCATDDSHYQATSAADEIVETFRAALDSIDVTPDNGDSGFVR